MLYSLSMEIKMSAQQITLAAKRVWLSTSDECYTVWIAKQKLMGFFWSASDV